VSGRTGEVEEKRAQWRRGLCQWCLGPVLSRRRLYCGEPCRHEYYLRISQSYVRGLVLQRDHGVCAACGRDCLALAQELTVLGSRSAGEFVASVRGLRLEKRCDNWSLWQAVARLEAMAGPNDGVVMRARLQVAPRMAFRSLWDADHTVALDEGGSHQLENVQTLCWACHRAKTAEHAARRAARRRASNVATES
jgi:HNH endonuclease